MEFSHRKLCDFKILLWNMRKKTQQYGEMFFAFFRIIKYLTAMEKSAQLLKGGKHYEKKIFRVLIGLVMVLCMVPSSAFAGSDNNCNGGRDCTHGARIGDVHYDTLDEAIEAAKTGDTITMLRDYDYAQYGSGLLNIDVSCTLDGNDSTISGWGSRSGNSTTIAINNSGSSTINVTLKNLTVSNDAYNGRPIETRGNISVLTLENCKINATGAGNTQCLTIGGSQESSAEVNIIDTSINAGNAGYPIIVFNPVELKMSGGQVEGYCGIYFKGVNGSTGSRNSNVDINGTTFDCPNVHSGTGNDFGIFVFEDDGITLEMTDCDISGAAEGSALQSVFMLSNYSDRKEQLVKTIISGDSTVTGQLVAIEGWDGENVFDSYILGGIFSDDDVLKYASENVIKFRDDGEDTFFVGTVEEINLFVSDNAITEVTVMKANEEAGFTFPENTKVTNSTDVDISVNGDTVPPNEEIIAKEPAASEKPNGQTTPAEESKPTAPADQSGEDNAPATGDNTNVVISVVAVVFAILVAAAAVRRREQ